MNKEWIRSNIFKDGLYSLKSATINDDERTYYKFTVNVPVETENSIIAFEYKIDSEANCDFFMLCLDSEEILKDSGQKDWKSFSYNLAPGKHVFKFEYTKDSTTRAGTDSVYIDNLNIKCQGNISVVESGVKELQYSLDDGHTWVKYENPVQLSPGPNNIKAKAIDNAGNESDIEEAIINYDVLEMTFDKNLINFGDITGLETEEALNFTVSSSNNYDISIYSKEDLVSDNGIIPINKMQASVDIEGYKRMDKDIKIPLVDNIMWGIDNPHTLKLKTDALVGYNSGNYSGTLIIEAMQK